MAEEINPSGARKSAGLVFAADLGGTHLRAATVDHSGQIHFRLKHSTPQAEAGDEIVQALVVAVGECEKQITESAEGAGTPIKAVSVVVPGTINVEEGIVVKAPNVPSLNGFRLTEALTKALQLPAILENDANAAA